MYILPIIIIQFDKEIKSKALPYLRGAVIGSLKKKDILFHNHDKDGLRYAYPLIQYKRINRKAAIMGIGKGINVISQLLVAHNFNYQIGNEQVEMCIEAVNSYDNEIILTENASYHYRLQNWLPLNTYNYTQFQNSESLVKSIQILERVLIGNILSFLKGIDIHLDEEVTVHITDITGHRIVIYKKMRLMAFDIEFKTNIQLPQYIGIGKNTSIGYGVLTKITNNKTNNHE